MNILRKLTLKFQIQNVLNENVSQILLEAALETLFKYLRLLIHSKGEGRSDVKVGGVMLDILYVPLAQH